MKCYKCGASLPAGSNNCPSCGQLVFTRDIQPGTMAFGHRLDGCLPEEPSASDFRASPNLTTLPSSVDLRSGCTAVEDQGQLGSCTANAAVGAMEYYLGKKGEAQTDLSRLFVYYNARRMDGTQDKDNGSRISQGMAALLAFGVPPEQKWPYDIARFAETPPREVFDEAAANTPTEYARVDGLENVKGALARGYPVVFAASLPTDYWKTVGKDGRGKSPTDKELENAATPSGTHAMLLVGYDDNAGHLVIRNSWGTVFGDQGYFYLPAETWQKAMAANTTWILGNLEASGDFTVVRPKLEIKDVKGSVKDMAEKLRQDIRTGLEAEIKDSFKDIKNRFRPPF